MSRLNQTKFRVVIDKQGNIQFIYSDQLVRLLGIGESKTIRASHVEPDGSGFWKADMSPVGGPTLIGFKLRDEALQAEHDWIINNVLGKVQIQ